jgi:ABC-type transport system involved in multi-copper enzyme maturation permease subunit
MSDPTTNAAESAPRTTPRAAGKSVPIFSIGRVYTIASSTVTQLVRMKTFYFLLAFALVVVAVGNFNLPATPAKELSMIKKVSFGTMDLFAWLFAIVATALLLPRDQEDRTLYTILSKPVRRIEYLLGKLGGVLAVIAISLVAMYAICAVVIFSRESLFVSAEYESMVASGQYTEAEIEEQLSLIQQQGLRAELGIAVLASFFKAAVVAVVTIFLSTFASSSLFTIIVSILLFLIGHAHTMASSFWLHSSDNSLFVQMLVKVVKILIPDFQLYSFSEGIVQGEAVVPALVGQMGLVTAGYLVVFLLLSLLVFVDKEF